MGNTLSFLKQKIDVALKQNIPFTSYRKPFFDEIMFISQKDATLNYLENYSQKGFVFAPFKTTENTILFPLDLCEMDSILVKEALNFENLEENSKFKIQNIAKESHIKLVEKGIAFIKNSTAKKVVLSRKETCSVSNFNPLDSFLKLLKHYKDAFVYLWYHPKIGLWLGATPETLIQIKNNKFKTMSLAGTQKYEGTLDVTWKNKEIKEQQYVTNYIVNKLTHLKIICKSSRACTTKAGNLVHLRSDISGKILQKEQLELIIKALHPTPAVCGLPKEKAKHFILENEAYHREFYTGFLGELNFEKVRKNNRKNIENHAYSTSYKISNLYVNLRCMQVNNNIINLYIGGGITAESDSRKEYLETVIKSKTIKKCL